MSSIENNIAYHPIKFSIKSNDLERLLKKPDKMFDKIDYLETDAELSLTKPELSKKHIALNIQLKNELILNGHPVVFSDVPHTKINKSCKRPLQTELEEVSKKTRKLEENDQVIIETETSTKFVIKALPRSVLPPPVSKEHSILKIFSKCHDGMKNKLEEKIDAIDLICQNPTTKSVSLIKSPNIKINKDVPTEQFLSLKDVKSMQEKRKDYRKSDSTSTLKSSKDNVKHSDCKILKEVQSHNDKRKEKFKDDKRIHKIYCEQGKEKKQESKIFEKKKARKVCLVNNDFSEKDTKFITKNKERNGLYRESIIKERHRSQKRHSSRDGKRSSKSYRSHSRKKSRHRSKESHHIKNSLSSPQLNKDNNKHPTDLAQTDSINLREEFLMEYKCDALNPENELEIKFQHKTNVTSIKNKINFAQNLQKLFNKAKVNEEQRSLKTKQLPPSSEITNEVQTDQSQRTENSKETAIDIPQESKLQLKLEKDVIIDPKMKTSILQPENIDSHLNDPSLSGYPKNQNINIKLAVSESEGNDNQPIEIGLSNQITPRAQSTKDNHIFSLSSQFPSVPSDSHDLIPSSIVQCPGQVHTAAREPKMQLSNISFRIKTNKTQQINVFIDNEDINSVKQDISMEDLSNNLSHTKSDTECLRNYFELEQSVPNNFDEERPTKISTNSCIIDEDQLKVSANFEKDKVFKEKTKSPINVSMDKVNKIHLKLIERKQKDFLSSATDSKDLPNNSKDSSQSLARLDNPIFQFPEIVKHQKEKEILEGNIKIELEKMKDSPKRTISIENLKPESKISRWHESCKLTSKLEIIQPTSKLSHEESTECDKYKDSSKKRSEIKKHIEGTIKREHSNEKADSKDTKKEQINLQKSKMDSIHSTDVLKPTFKVENVKENLIKQEKKNIVSSDVIAQFKDFKDTIRVINQLKTSKIAEKSADSLKEDRNFTTVKLETKTEYQSSHSKQQGNEKHSQEKRPRRSEKARKVRSRQRQDSSKGRSKSRDKHSRKREKSSSRRRKHSGRHKMSKRRRRSPRSKECRGSRSSDVREKSRIKYKDCRDDFRSTKKPKYHEESYKSAKSKKDNSRLHSSRERSKSKDEYRRKRRNSRRSPRMHTRGSKSLDSCDSRHKSSNWRYNVKKDKSICKTKSDDKIAEKSKSKSRFRSMSTSTDESDSKSIGLTKETKISKSGVTDLSKSFEKGDDSTRMSFKNLSVDGIPLNSIPMPFSTIKLDTKDNTTELKDTITVIESTENSLKLGDDARDKCSVEDNVPSVLLTKQEQQNVDSITSGEETCSSNVIEKLDDGNVVIIPSTSIVIQEPIKPYVTPSQANQFVSNDYYSNPLPCVPIYDQTPNLNFFACTPPPAMLRPPYVSSIHFNNYSLQSVFQPTYQNVQPPPSNNTYMIPPYTDYTNSYLPNSGTASLYKVPPLKSSFPIYNSGFMTRDPRCHSYLSNVLECNEIIKQSYEDCIQLNELDTNLTKTDENLNTKSSSTSSLSNLDIDMDIASKSPKSINSLNEPKLDEEHSEKDDLSSCGDFDFDDGEIQDPFQKYADAPRPQYEHIIKTEIHPSAVGKRFEYAYLKSTSCNCIPPNPDEIRLGKAACDENCFNRKIKVECNRTCPVYDLCTNRRFQEQIYSAIEPYYVGKDKGWGIRSLSNIAPGTFVIEYVGELINFDEFLRRLNQNSTYDHHFLMVIQKDMYIDAGYKGNWARFVNHSCDPNTMIERWVVNGKTRIGLFAKKAIQKDEEITIDYQFQQYGSVEQSCYCCSANCTGIMGKVNEKLQEQIRMSAVRHQKELIQRIISRKSLKEINHVSEMITVIKENCLDRDTFFSFLEVLLRSSSIQCIRTFIDCGGLNVITSYLDSVSWNDWSLKLLYLQCIDHFKLKKRTLIHSGYTSATVVDYWSKNPRYALKHVVEESLNVDNFNDDAETVSDSLEPTPVENESNIQFSLPNNEEPVSDIEKQVQSLAVKIKEYFNEENEKFFIPKIKTNQIDFLNDLSANDSESKSISIASSLQGDFVQVKKRRLRKKCDEVIQKLSKDEFRRLFSERYHKSLLEKNQSITTVENNNDKHSDAMQSIKQLLANVITDEINCLKQNEQFSTMPLEFQNLDIDKILSDLNIVEKDGVICLSNQIQEDVNKSASLSNYSDDTSKSDQETPLSETPRLPPNWRFCHSENGRIYFYHTISKKTQWETPIYPWDAGDKDPSSYDFGDAHNYQVSHEDIIDMYIKLRIKRREEKERERQRKKLQKKLSLSDGERNKIKFSREVFKTVKIQMKPYFSSSCKVGRVRSKVDLKFLCEKFADTIIGKEVKLVANLEDLELNSDVSSRLRSYIDKYMRNQGKYFKRSKKQKEAVATRTSNKKIDSQSRTTTNLSTL